MNPLERKPVREVDRISWKPSFPVLTRVDLNEGLNNLTKLYKCPEGKADIKVWGQLEKLTHFTILVTNKVIQNMMKPLEI